MRRYCIGGSYYACFNAPPVFRNTPAQSGSVELPRVDFLVGRNHRTRNFEAVRPSRECEAKRLSAMCIVVLREEPNFDQGHVRIVEREQDLDDRMNAGGSGKENDIRVLGDVAVMAKLSRCDPRGNKLHQAHPVRRYQADGEPERGLVVRLVLSIDFTKKVAHRDNRRPGCDTSNAMSPAGIRKRFLSAS